MAKNRSQERLQSPRSAPLAAPRPTRTADLAPQERTDRLMDMLMSQLDEANARADGMRALATHFSVVLRALFAGCEEDGEVRISAQTLANAQAFDVEMTDNDGTLVLTMTEPTTEEVDTDG